MAAQDGLLSTYLPSVAASLCWKEPSAVLANAVLSNSMPLRTNAGESNGSCVSRRHVLSTMNQDRIGCLLIA
jgi:hypothetical protein